MADLYGVGCTQCNREVAAFVREGPHMDGYLDASAYWAKYANLAASMPLPYVDGEYKEHTAVTVAGEDGWLLAMQGTPHLCRCGAQEIESELWRGRVELR